MYARSAGGQRYIQTVVDHNLRVCPSRSVNSEPHQLREGLCSKALFTNLNPADSCAGSVADFRQQRSLVLAGQVF
jgi:hypothetical protein